MKVKIITDTMIGVSSETIDLTTCPKFHKFRRESIDTLTKLKDQILELIYDYMIRVRGVDIETIDDIVIKSIDFGDYLL